MREGFAPAGNLASVWLGVTAHNADKKRANRGTQSVRAVPVPIQNRASDLRLFL